MKLGWRVLSWFMVFNFVSLLWPMICYDDWSSAMTLYDRIINNFQAGELITLMHKAGFALVLVLIGYVLHFLPKRCNNFVVSMVTRSGFVGQLVVMVVAIWIVMQCQLMLAADGGGLPVYAAF